ncbi:S-adenosylhomocysteine hydrolase [Vibrio sp. SCSIO 43132]|uniref:DUF3653 domain-containing protein n=1 Tax=Vibrio sp. SCSIO 43132 TaxID=2779363 RepID=UPI001CA80008|nr:DUF3653 domain-containing protein [Vibrio sp. SCSIO 43132]UAB72398.1 S-adenosylhomocysteine hydrolase [Vibrio sp. SCSIO 43132]
MNKDINEDLYNSGFYTNQILDLFIWHFDDDKQAANFFGVTPKTVQSWRNKRKWSVAVIRLLLIMHRGYLPPDRAWRGFKIRGDKLYTPGGRELSAYDLQELDIKVSLGQNVVEFRRKKNRVRKSNLMLRRYKNRALLRPK